MKQLFAVLFVVIIASAACVPGSPDTGCDLGDGDCEAPLECIDGKCAEPGGVGAHCDWLGGTRDDGCADGLRCGFGRCFAPGTPDCVDDSDCDADEVCAGTSDCSRKCTARGAIGDGCGVCDSDCEAGCCPSDVGCGPGLECTILSEGGDCQSGVCAPNQCQDDDGCDAGTFCVSVDCGHACRPAAGEGELCAGGGECGVSDQPCAEGLECAGGDRGGLVCIPPRDAGGACVDLAPAENDGCIDGLHCAFGICGDLIACDSSHPCPEGQGCGDGICHERACASDVDCADNLDGNTACFFHGLSAACGSECAAPRALHEECAQRDSAADGCETFSISCADGLACIVETSTATAFTSTCTDSP